MSGTLAPTTTTQGAPTTGAHNPTRLTMAREMARELNDAHVLGTAAGTVWSMAETGKVSRDAWRSLLALACDLVELAGYVAPDAETAENVGAVAADLSAALFGGPITPTPAAPARRMAA